MEWENSIMWVCTQFIYILDFSILHTTCLYFSSILAKRQHKTKIQNKTRRDQKQQQEM